MPFLSQTVYTLSGKAIIETELVTDDHFFKDEVSLDFLAYFL